MADVSIKKFNFGIKIGLNLEVKTLEKEIGREKEETNLQEMTSKKETVFKKKKNEFSEEIRLFRIFCHSFYRKIIFLEQNRVFSPSLT